MLLLDTTVYTGAGTYTGSSVRLPRYTAAAEVLLNCSAAATGATDTGNVYVQASADNGTTWDDVISFTQLLGNGGAKKFLARWNALQAPTTATAAPAIATLAAGTVAQGPHGLLWRVQTVLVNVTSVSFTIRVTAALTEQK